MKKLLLILFACTAVAHGQTGTVTISQLPPMSTLSGSEKLLGVQSGTTGTVTTANLKAYNNAGMQAALTFSTGLNLSGTTVTINFGTTAGTALQGNATGTIVEAWSAKLDKIVALSTPSGTYVLSQNSSGTFAWIPQSGLGSLTIGTNAFGYFNFSNPTLDLAHPVNGASGFLALDGSGALPVLSGLLGNYINVSGGVQSYNAATTTLGNVTTGSGTIIVYSVSPTLTGTPTAPTASAGTNTTQIATTAFVQTAKAWEYENANFTAVAGHKYQVSTTGTVVTMTLPFSPANMDSIEVQDFALSFSTHNFLITASGSVTINGTITTYTDPVPGDKLNCTASVSGTTVNWSIK